MIIWWIGGYMHMRVQYGFGNEFKMWYAEFEVGYFEDLPGLIEWECFPDMWFIVV